MNSYLISGLSGTGKSTLGYELEKSGYDVISADEAFGYNGVLKTEAPIEPPTIPTYDWYADHGWIWDSSTLMPLLKAKRTKPLFVCGGSRNESKFYEFFDAVFVLHAPDAVLRERLQSRTDPHTSSELFITRMLAYNRVTYDRARGISGIIIETTKPLEQCVNIIIDRINEA